MTADMINALWCMLTSMVGIFTVTLVIILCIKLLNKSTSDKNEGEQKPQ